jgi:hypothetical protein
MLLSRVALFCAFMVGWGSPALSDELGCPGGSTRVEEATETGELGEWCERNGLREGAYRLRVQGVVVRSGEFRQGRMNGVWKRYSESGRLIDEGPWKDNRPDGTWTFYDTLGNVHHQTLYREGLPVPDPTGESNPWIWKRAQVLGAAILQRSGGQVGTLFLSYHPGFKRSELTEWVGAISVGGLKSRDPSKPFVWVLSGSAGMRFRLKQLERLRLEPRIGIQSWIGSATAPSLNFDTGYDFLEGRAAVVGGVEQVNFKVNGTTVLRVGLEYRLGD